MNRFITVKKTDAEFSKYIWGTFSETERALPIESLNTGTDQESVTFEIVLASKIQKPGFFKLLSRLIKWNYFFLVFVPLYYVLVKNFVYQRLFDLQSFALAAGASLLLFAGLNMRNDVFDHVSGFDRIIKSSNEKPIILGWVTAQQVHFISWLFLFAAAALALPVCYYQHEAGRVAAITLLFFFLGNFLTKNNYKHKYFSEFLLFMVLGPALCSGYQVALGSGVDTEILVFGVTWGIGVLFLLYLVQYANLFETSQSGIKNTLTRMGFDKSKSFLKIWWGLFLVFWVAYHYFYGSVFWLALSIISLGLCTIPTFNVISNAGSPIGSSLRRVRHAGFRLFIVMVVILVLEQTWYLYTHLDWVL